MVGLWEKGPIDRELTDFSGVTCFDSRAYTSSKSLGDPMSPLRLSISLSLSLSLDWHFCRVLGREVFLWETLLFQFFQ